MTFHTKKSVFSNCFNLNIKNNYLQNKYEFEIGEKNITILIYLIGMVFVLIIGLAQLSRLNLSTIVTNDYKDSNGILYFGYACIIPTTIGVILYLFKLKFANVRYPMLFFIELSLFMNSHFFVEYYTVLLDKTFMNFDFIAYSIYFTASISYIIFVDNNFIRTFFSNVAIILLNVVAFSPTIIQQSKIIDLVVSYIIRICLYYFMCRISKISFYYKEKFEMQKNWVYDILNHSNSGIIIYNVNKQKVKFFNEYLKKFEQFKVTNLNEFDIIKNVVHNNLQLGHRETSETSDLQNQTALHVNDSIRNNDNINSKANLNDLRVVKKILFDYNIFSRIYDINQDLPLELRNAFFNKNFDEIINIINNVYSEIENEARNKSANFFEGFIYFGHISLREFNERDDNNNNNDVNSELGIFEFYMRGLRNSNGTYFEFMINDVTKTKKQEENRLKEKTLILGKISHEFKNPIIVIEEVIDQIIELNGFENQLGNLVSKNKSFSVDDEIAYMRKLNFVKNLCQYMIILIKDFEVVSSIENNNQLDVFISSINLNDFLSEIEDIIDTLISKKTPNQNPMVSKIQFNIQMDEDIDEIKTDQIRLKQILINLISNSVKFVEQGSISLQVKRRHNTNTKNIYLDNNDLDNNDNNLQIPDLYSNPENEYIRFSIIDTGEGVSDELIKRINSETSDDKEGDIFKEAPLIKKENSNRNGLGSGYGLNIIQKLCKLLSSNLRVKKNFPYGTIFYFDMPELNLSRKERLPNIEIINSSMTHNSAENNISRNQINLIIDSAVDVDHNENKIQNENENDYFNDICNYSLQNNIVDINNDYNILKKCESEVSNYKLVFDEYSRKGNNDNNDIDIDNCNDLSDSKYSVKKIFDLKLPKHFLSKQEPSTKKKERTNSTNNLLSKDEQVELKTIEKSDLPKPSKDILNPISRNDNHIQKCSSLQLKQPSTMLTEPFANSNFNQNSLRLRQSPRINISPKISYRSISSNIKYNILEFEQNEVRVRKKSAFVESIPSNNFEMNLVIHRIFIKNTESNNDDVVLNPNLQIKKYTFLIVDDEFFIRSSVKRVITSYLKSLNENINLEIIEACDGIECLLALYIAKNKKLKIHAIISDETMPFISGSYLSKILDELVSKGSLNNVKMFVSTALSHTNISNYFSKVVQKIFSKPLDKTVIQEILQSIDK